VQGDQVFGSVRVIALPFEPLGDGGRDTLYLDWRVEESQGGQGSQYLWDRDDGRLDRLHRLVTVSHPQRAAGLVHADANGCQRLPFRNSFPNSVWERTSAKLCFAQL